MKSCPDCHQSLAVPQRPCGYLGRHPVWCATCEGCHSANCVACYRDGTITYHDPLRDQWIEKARTIPIYALTVLPAEEEARVRRHLARHGVFL